jgi:hypothetical protein
MMPYKNTGTSVWKVGDELPAITRRMTRERIRWYADALLSTSEPELTAMIAGANVHTDDEFARAEGLSGIISDGMISTNWLSSVLIAAFGQNYLTRGSLQTKYIRPIFEDQLISARAKVRSVSTGLQGFDVELEVWCEDETGQKVTVGSALIAGVE